MRPLGAGATFGGVPTNPELFMAEATQYTFSHQELLKVLVKHQGLHEGVWQLLVNFGFQAGNLGPNANELNPGAMIVIGGVGLQRTTEKTNLTIDAAEANPASDAPR
jgi:hypothetical protein